MASFRQFPLIALIFGFILVSSFVNAARITDGSLPHWDCAPLVDEPCLHDEGCAMTCYQQKFGYAPGRCVGPKDPSGFGHCCCVNPPN
ncbi:hypothetical protein MKX01_023443 [Papaver californicum]|nr:hypothetical protein MKX01_023443 [Papaver californicum]